jgi:pilus assembly protein CpaE
VVDQVRRSIPCVMVDLPHAWTPWARNTLLAADEIVLVATPDLASLRNTKNMLDVIRARRPNDTPPKLVINQTGMPKRPEIPIKEFAAAVDLQPSVVLPFDPQLFGTAANNGQMIPEVQPAAPTSEGIRKLAGMITRRAVTHVSKKGKLSFLPFISNRKAG